MREPQAPNRMKSWLSPRVTSWGIIALVLIPTSFLLQRQWRWLAEWRSASSFANELAMERALTTIDARLKQQIERLADAYLAAPSSVMADDESLRRYVQTRAKRLTQREQGFVSLVLAQSFVPGFNDSPLLVSAKDGTPIATVEPDLAEASFVATLHWKLLAEKLVSLGPSGYSVEDRDTQFPMVLAPVSDEERRLVGVVGIVLDPQQIQADLIPGLIGSVLAEMPHTDPFTLCVHNADGQVVFAQNPDHMHESTSLTMRPSFIFTDWQFQLEASDEFAGRMTDSLWLNMALSVALALMLITGIGLALRVAAHHRHLSQLKTEFVSNVSHELRTPVSSIRAFAEMMATGRVHEPTKTQEFGKHIQDESERLSQLIENILDFSKLEGGTKQYTKRRVCVNELVERCAESFRCRCENTTINLVDACRERTYVHADADTLCMVLNNLIDNAIKYGPPGSPIQVALSANHDCVSVAVSDCGCGIAKDQQQRVFERFHRVGSGLNQPVRGTGLGLSIARHIAEDHGGTIYLDSEPGKGSTFTVELPRYQAPSQPEQAPAPAPSP